MNGTECMKISDVDTRDAFFDELFRMARVDRNVIFMTADMGAFSLERFKQNLPEQYINVGVAEQNMVSVAAGLALGGKNVFIYSIVPFVTLRCYEQIKVDLSGMNLPVTIIGIGAGVMYGGDGPTHHALHDIAVMRTLPGMTIINPTDSVLTEASVRWAYNHPGPVYIRLEKGKLPLLYDDRNHDLQKGWSEVREGQDVVIFSTGFMVHTALKAAESLAREGLSVRVIDVFKVKPLNEPDLIDMMLRAERIVTLEENSLIGGLGTALAEIRADAGCGVPMKRLACPDSHCTIPSSRDSIHRHYRLDADHVAERVLNWVRNNRETA